MELHSVLTSSVANGPGRRAVVWVQGCSLGCAGCYNPETHERSSGYELTPAEVLDRLAPDLSSVEGLTVSGGEPLEQIADVTELCGLVRATTDLSVLLFTGFTRAEIQKMPGTEDLLGHVDALITGRFNSALRQPRSLLGSSNQELWLVTERFTEADFAEVPMTEIIITPEGDIVASGIDPVAI